MSAAVLKQVRASIGKLVVPPILGIKGGVRDGMVGLQVVGFLQKGRHLIKVAPGFCTHNVVGRLIGTFGNQAQQEALRALDDKGVQAFWRETHLEQFAHACAGGREKVEGGESEGGSRKKWLYH